MENEQGVPPMDMAHVDAIHNKSMRLRGEYLGRYAEGNTASKSWGSVRLTESLSWRFTLLTGDEMREGNFQFLLCRSVSQSRSRAVYVLHDMYKLGLGWIVLYYQHH